MKYFSTISIVIALSGLWLSACLGGQGANGQTNLAATAFSEKIKELPGAPIIDVRTPDEFSNGHLKNAKNIDWNGDNFDSEIAGLDKTKPVFVYCLSGGRSSSAAAKMRSGGFKTVYELSGGMMKWRAANLPETTDNTIVSPGMTQAEFDQLLQTDKLVLIDIYAEWCAPCKKMKPYLDEISLDMKEKVTVVRIDADANKMLMKTLKVDELPVLLLYKNKSLIWTTTGYIDKEGVLSHLQ
ncbi:MAG: thioredoxin domain-containing protein [bacterium]|nr:thioredoxin domain-containing protein [bacterium]